ncbi:conserved hypothetical protein [Candidatus Brocadia sinica JPN1]|uniref:DUF1611 domain-containing protein n=2 Tax=Candidatus Brocadiaceae TaxID=1127830 RepID=A0ABQ0JXP9_9BACT|nr:conserved hypothetical protein [Candidatus Brocadia sinica JPN1]GIK13321.1 MAG: hypothetical protein BroJett002_20280 [Candidatus Brocadia sinica]GJQ19050.1 MAG: hypothetical protein HBSIN01_30090 [Candidatus Brocadia sinica]
MYSMTNRRLVILTEGRLDVFSAKTAVSVIRYRKEDVVALIDRVNAGKDIESIIGIGKGIPIVSTIAETLHLKPTALLIGIAPPGGMLPAEWRKHITDALINKLHIISGLHCHLDDDPEFCKLAHDHQREIWDVRKPPEDIPLGSGKAKETKTLRILTVGSDCNIGKMVTSIEIANAAKKRGFNACFVATGQTGIMIDGSGIAVDHVISDFISGAAEKLVIDRSHYHLLSIEGQGTIVHPAYSGVTLGLLHGAAPQGLILCHQPTRKTLRHFANFPILPLPYLIDLYEKLAQPVHPCKVIGISLNCFGMTDHDALQEIQKVEKETKLPATDPIKFGVNKFIDGIRPLLP